jgi:hypothetical protein
MTALARVEGEDQPLIETAKITVSFLVTSYNKAVYLPTVLETVWREAKAVGGEVILIDDGSIDGSGDICEVFAGNHPLAFYHRQENSGIYRTINSIASKARGIWIRFCDSDDPIVPGSTRRLIEAAESCGAGVAYGGAIVYGPEPLAVERIRAWLGSATPGFVHEDGLMHLIRDMDFTPSMTIYRRSVLKDAFPLPAGLVSCQDLAILFPVLQTSTIASIDEPVCFNLKGAPNQLSANYALTLHQTIRITQHFADLLSPEHKKAALLKAANRTRRWLRREGSSRGTLLTQLWLVTVVLGARIGALEFTTTLEKIAKLYEPDLEPILERRARPF